MIELVNEIYHAKDDPARAGEVRFATEAAVSLIQPYAPHLAEELWERLGRTRLWDEPWPQADPALLERDTFELVVQVNGKVRDKVEVPVGLSEAELLARAKELPRVRLTWTARRSARRSSSRASSSTSSCRGPGEATAVPPSPPAFPIRTLSR